MKNKVAIFLSVVFFLIALKTLPDYGINWDTINHLPRGQAYLHYFLSGKKDYSDLPPFKIYWQKPGTLFFDPDIPKDQLTRRSYYQSDELNMQWNIIKDSKGGHPPLSDILSAFFNYILFQKLGWINDIDSYRVYGVLLSACLIGLIYIWGKQYGKFAGLISALSLSVYPLFWAESHFNTEKDVPETVFWSFMLYTFWKGITTRSWKWLVASGIFFGLALGTKFNILFAGPLLGIWLLVYLLSLKSNKKSLINKFKENWKLWLAVLAIPLIGFSIFFASWPLLWRGVVPGVASAIGFYKTIGTTTGFDSRYIWHFGINLYPIKWIIYTTPLVIMVLSITGFLRSLFKIRQEKDKLTLLFLLWLIIPILRVSLHGTNIYGGVRQIMEYIPAVAIFAGLGAVTIKDYSSKIFNNRWLAGFVIIIAFIPIIYKLVSIHPYEDVYFNPLIGGLSGAKQKDIPSWGDNFGGAYRYAVNWIDNNAPLGSKLVLAHELMPSIPNIWLRTDLQFSNTYRSAYLQQGEYALTLTYQGTEDRSYYDSFLEQFLQPVYEAKVDNVAIAKVWKNDPAHLRVKLAEQQLNTFNLTKDNQGLKFDLGQIYKLSRIEIDYFQENCNSLKSGITEVSTDNSNWQTLPENFANSWRIAVLGPQPFNGKFIEPFAAPEARYVQFMLSPDNTCLKNVINSRVYYFN